MADANLPPPPSPGGWGDAFAAMPLERAPADAWARLSAALPAASGARGPDGPRRRDGARRGLRIGLAAAASVAFAMPMAWWLGTSPQAPTRTAVDHVAAADAGRARQVARDATPPASTLKGAKDIDADRVDDAHGGAAGIPERSGLAAAPVDARAGSTPRITRRTTPARGIDAGTKGTSPDAAGNVADTGAIDPAAAAETASTDLASLRQESARLEALVAYARDGRMESAPAAVMSAAMDDRIRLIDAALMEPMLDATTRTSLWNERVGALRELASLEGTQRWMAAQGTSMDAVARVD